jgi:hypothetical protein
LAVFFDCLVLREYRVFRGGKSAAIIEWKRRLGNETAETGCCAGRWKPKVDLPPSPATRAAPLNTCHRRVDVGPHGSRTNAPSPLNLQASFLSAGPHCLVGVDANRKQYLGAPLADAAMLNAVALALAAAAWQRKGASAAATFFRATFPALPLMGKAFQLPKSTCLTQRVPWGVGLGGEGLGLGPGAGLGLTPGAVNAARGVKAERIGTVRVTPALRCR